MDNKEAISELKCLREDYWDDDGYGHETKEYEDTMVALDMAIKALEQESKTGYWIKYGIPRYEEQHYKCTLCGYYINFGQWGKVYTKQFKYCPNCGVEMEGEQVFGNNEYYPECEEFIVSKGQVKYIEIVEKVKESLSKVLFTKEVSDIGLANEDMNKGAIIAYQDIYNRIVELEHDEPREDSISQ